MYQPTYLGEIELSDDTLAHYGVKGMRWRHRKGKFQSDLYKAKGRSMEFRAKLNRMFRGMGASTISYNRGKSTFDRQDNGKARSTTNTQGNKSYRGKLELNNKGYSKSAHERSGAGINTSERSNKIQREQHMEMLRKSLKKKKR